MKLLLTLLLLFALVFSGCARTTVVRPGSISTFDAAAFDALRTVKLTLPELRTLADANPAIWPAVNNAIRAYNTAETAWQAYHAAGNAQASTADLAKLVGAATAAIASVFNQLGAQPSAPIPDSNLHWPLRFSFAEAV